MLIAETSKFGCDGSARRRRWGKWEEGTGQGSIEGLLGKRFNCSVGFQDYGAHGWEEDLNTVY